MIIVGLTGGIAMGKTTVAGQFALLGAKTLCSDAVVHELLSPGGHAHPDVMQHFPHVIIDGAISRKELGKTVFSDIQSLDKLEEILHPLVVREQKAFIRRQAGLGTRIVVLDIPLLFETGAEARCDLTVTVSAPALLQKQRAMARMGMDEVKLRSILKRQLDDRTRCELADFVVQTGLGKGSSMKQVKQVMQVLC